MIASTAAIVRKEVRELLSLSPAFARLPVAEQKGLARNMTKVATYLAEAVEFPEFVASLIKGVFNAIVNASIQQMEAYAELVANAAKSVDQFAEDNITDEDARDWLASTYPEYFKCEPFPQCVTIRLKRGIDRAMAIRRLRLLPLERDLGVLDAQEIESVLVPAARRRLALSRQQLLAGMVLMGMNRAAR